MQNLTPPASLSMIELLRQDQVTPRTPLTTKNLKKDVQAREVEAVPQFSNDSDHTHRTQQRAQRTSEKSYLQREEGSVTAGTGKQRSLEQKPMKLQCFKD